MNTDPAVTGTGMPADLHLDRRSNAATPSGRGSVPVALLRITLGVIILATWYDNLTKDLYTAEGLEGFLAWLSTPVAEGGNGGTLDVYHSFLDTVVVPIAGPYALFQLVAELAMGVGLLIGALTRLFSLAAAVFFATIFLGYVGGEEWIWTYVLLIMASITVFAGYGGRVLGVDRFLADRFGSSPLGNLGW